MIELPTEKLQAIYDRLIEIEDDPHPDFDDSMYELQTLEEKADSLSEIFEIPGIKGIQESVRLYNAITEKIRQLRYDISGFDPQIELIRMFPNIEDYDDYCNGEF